MASLGTGVLSGGVASASSGDLDRGFGAAGHGRATFDLGVATYLRGLAVQPGGGIVPVGQSFRNTSDAVAYRLNPDGTPDTRFGNVKLPATPDAVEEAVAAVTQPDGKVVVAGTVTDPSGGGDFSVWRLTPTGRLDTSFSGDGQMILGSALIDEEAADVALDPQGRVVVVGTAVGTDREITVLRFTAQGTPDATFNSGQAAFVLNHLGGDSATGLAVQSDGEIVVAGEYAGSGGAAVLRITPGTSTTPAHLDMGFGGGDGIAVVSGTTPAAHDVGVADDGSILLLGSVFIGGDAITTVVRLDGVGGVDGTFGSADGTGSHIDLQAGSGLGHALTVLHGGGIAVLGSDAATSYVAKLDANGAPDRGMGPKGIRTLPALDPGLGAGIAELPDGRIIAVGNLAGTSDTGVAYRLVGDFTAPSCAGKKATMTGTKASDKLVGTPGTDVIAGLGGGDRITGLGKGDVVCGGPGRDRIVGGAGGDHLLGQAGADTLVGGEGDDRLIGGPGHDTLKGGPGTDFTKQ